MSTEPAKSGRKPKAHALKQGRCVSVHLTDAQIAELDAARGAVSRSAYLARYLTHKEPP